MNNNNGYSILFVDDEQKALKYFEKAFSADFHILTCDNASDAKQLLTENSDSIAILLSDQRMPDQKGTELLTYARENHPHIIRLLTTAYSDLTDAIEAVNNGEILRYLNKPWDIQELKAELQYAMRFYMLRHERDQLLKEKLNVKQRMLELNRVRDLIVMSSGFTHIRNPLHAIAAFLSQVPIGQEQELADMQSLDIWGLLEREIFTQLELTQQLINATLVKEGFKTALINQTLEKIAREHEQAFEVKTETTPANINAELIEKMLLGIINTANDETQRKLIITVAQNQDGIKIIINADENDKETSSLLGMSGELLTAFFVAYHHNGNLIIHDAQTLHYEINLPLDPDNSPLPALSDDWLEEVFYRFESWV